MLKFDLYVNDTPIGRFEATRITNVSTRPNEDDVNTYQIYARQHDEMWTGQVQHRYGDGAFELIRLACHAMAMEGGPH